MYNFITNIEYCYYGISNLIYYTHIPVAIVALILGIFVFIKNPRLLSAKLLLSISLTFSLWVILNLIVWVDPNSIIVSFAWTFFVLLTSLLFLGCLYFTQTYITKKDVGTITKLIWLVLLLPLFIFIEKGAPGFDIINCEVIENNLYIYYGYAIQIIFVVWLLLTSIINYLKTKDSGERKQIIYLTFGISAFLISFYITSVLSVYLNNFNLEQYGLFGMIIFMAYLAFLIVRFKAFDIKLLGAQALVWTLVILIGSQFFFIRNNINRVLTAFTLLFATISGILIVKSVKKEVAQREEIERLASSLEKANNRLEEVNLTIQAANERLKELDQMKSEFVSLATHQIRGPLAAIKGYVSLMTEGDYGEVPDNFKEPLGVVFKSTDSLSHMVTDFLDVSRLDLGQMKYDFTNFDFKDLVNEVTKELKPNVDAHGLEFRIKITDSACPVKADRTKLKQVLNNLVDNSSKYTKSGWLEVSVEKRDNKVLFAVKDSGVGMSQKTISVLFQRFSRAKNANETNILGTGLGLYIAKKMVDAHEGKVWAESEGDGKGSQFYVELNLAE